MSQPDAEQVVTKSIVVAVDAAWAFRVWTEQIKAWWPAGHSLSGDPATQVLLEGKVGGRFYERASNGSEYDWGAIQVWEPPYRLAFTWYLGSSRELPSRVEVQFVALNETTTRLELEHRGPELIGELWGQRQHLFKGAWDKVLSELVDFLAA